MEPETGLLVDYRLQCGFRVPLKRGLCGLKREYTVVDQLSGILLKLIKMVSTCLIGKGEQQGEFIAPPKVDRIGDIWGSCYNIPKASFYLLKWD